jgi:hypothetical protein
MSIVVIQHIVTKWDKSARGGENAVQRNAVPEAAKLSVAQWEGRGIEVLQQSLYYRWDRSVDPIERITTNPPARPIRIGCVVVEVAGEEVTAEFRYDRGCGGAPERGWARKTMRVSQEMWVQMVYNGRFTGEDYWWYEKHVVNVGLFERLSSGLFTRCAPATRFEAMGELH